MKINRSVAYSVGVSLVFHTMLFSLAMSIRIFGFKGKTEKPPQFFKLQMVAKDKIANSLPMNQSHALEPLRMERPQGMTLSSNGLNKKDKSLKKTQWMPQTKKIAEPIVISRTVTQEVFQKEIKKSADPIRKFERRDTNKESLPDLKPSQEQLAISPEKVFKINEQLSKEFQDTMPGFTPSLVDNPLKSSNQAKGVLYPSGKGSKSAIQRMGNYGKLQHLLEAELTKYVDPKDGGKYFKISIRLGKEGAEMPTIPKEIAFLVDCSISIEQERLEKFKKGLEYCLTHLNKEDHFNIIAFKEDMFKFQPKPVEPSEANQKLALKFISSLKAGEKTDAYEALYQTIKEETPQNPSYILFLSDGLATKGVTDPRDIIHQISEFNRGRASIFAFSGGLQVNRYLLDFIAYKNRGWAQYSYRSNMIDKKLSDLYNKVKDPILLQLRYNISGQESAEIFPVQLPDFFRKAEFTLYGKYATDEQFAFQLLGLNKDSETMEFIFEGSLKDAPAGKVDIARGWAFNKVYHLIGMLENNKDNKSFVDEINALSKKFDLKIPYMDYIR